MVLNVGAALILGLLTGGQWGQEPGVSPVVPQEVLQAAQDTVIANVGGDFFLRCVRMDLLNTKCLRLGPSMEPFYRVRYDILPPESPWVLGYINIEFLCSVPLTLRAPIVGLPRCASRPSECVFPVTKEDALRVAKERGLSGNVHDWRISFQFSSPLDTYYWGIRVYTGWDSTGAATEAEHAWIDANDGGLLKLSKEPVHHRRD